MFMELKDFISSTISHIAEGVQEAIDTSKGKGYLVSPGGDKFGKNCVVHFDLSIESGKEGAASIKVIGGGINEKSINRIKFDVHMYLPYPKISSSKPDHRKISGGNADHTKAE